MTDKTVRAKFFKLYPYDDKTPLFENVLSKIFEIPTSVEREQELADGSVFRLESLSNDNTYLEGEIIRKQTANMPPEANDDGLIILPLSDGGGLAHSVAFCYNIETKIIAVQSIQSLSVSRFMKYLTRFDYKYNYTPKALLKHDAWEKYERSEPKSFELSLAIPENINRIEGESDNFIEGIQRLGNISGAPQITITVSMGYTKGSLNKNIIRSTLQFLDVAPEGINVKKMRSRSKLDGKTETIDFIEDILKDAAELELSDDPVTNYQRRKSWLKTCFNDNDMHIANY